MRHGGGCGILGVFPSREDLIEDAVGFIVVIGLIVAVVSGVVSSSIAKSKGRSGTLYFFLGFLFPLIGILAAGFAVPPQTYTPLPPSEWTRQRDRTEADNARRRDIEGRLGKIGELHRDGLISDDELKRRRQEIIDEI